MLKFAQQKASRGAALRPFYGGVFERKGSGHLLNQHYLDPMFEMERGVVKEGNAFMDTLVEPDGVNDGATIANA